MWAQKAVHHPWLSIHKISGYVKLWFGFELFAVLHFLGIVHGGCTAAFQIDY